MENSVILSQVLNTKLLQRYREVRSHSEYICKPLETEDYVVQPVADVSPPKWHLGHTTWFFETFVLLPHYKGYQIFNAQYNFVFNSYYESVGVRVLRTDRGNLSRPSVNDVYRYRAYIDDNMEQFLQSTAFSSNLAALLELGINHEQQHQELLYSDIKYILGHNPLFPAYRNDEVFKEAQSQEDGFISVLSGMYEIGYEGTDFCFDNEMAKHKVYLEEFQVSQNLVTNAEYLWFMEDGGYTDFRYWHSEGWEWVKQSDTHAPLYWHNIDGRWVHYTLNGLVDIDPNLPVCHVNFYEAAAFAAWKGTRLLSEAEWEVASSQLDWGKRWEWTNSAYLPYPGFKKDAGAIGEYNGKFMVNQMVLRGASVATPAGHSRTTYRNFFHARHQWQFTGIRLAK